MADTNIPQGWEGQHDEVLAYSFDNRPRAGSLGQIESMGGSPVVDRFSGTLEDVETTGIVLVMDGQRFFFTWHAVLRISLFDDPEAGEQ